MKRSLNVVIAAVLMLTGAVAFGGNVTSKFDIDIYGYIKLDAVYDTQRTVDGGIMLWVVPEGPDGKDSEFNFTAWESRLGFNIKGPDLGGAKTTGKIEGDFYGGTMAKGTDGKPQPHKAMYRMRLAYADIAGASWSIRMGQDWDAFITVIPTSVNFTYFGEQGSPGYRRPQIYATKSLDLAGCKLTTKLGIARTLGEMTQAMDVDKGGQDDGVDAALPSGEANVILETPFFAGQKAKFSVSGAYGIETLDQTTGTTFTVTSADADDYASQLVMCSAVIPMGKMVSLKGAIWTGKNLDAYEAGILQGINSTLKTEIEANGGWAQLVVNPTVKLNVNLGYGVDDPKDSDLNPNGRAKNTYPMGSVFYKFNDALTLAFEYSRPTTSYKGADDVTDDRFHGAMYYRF